MMAVRKHVLQHVIAPRQQAAECIPLGGNGGFAGSGTLAFDGGGARQAPHTTECKQGPARHRSERMTDGVPGEHPARCTPSQFDTNPMAMNKSDRLMYSFFSDVSPANAPPSIVRIRLQSNHLCRDHHVCMHVWIEAGMVRPADDVQFGQRRHPTEHAYLDRRDVIVRQ